jgi:hypothetical protein
VALGKVRRSTNRLDLWIRAVKPDQAVATGRSYSVATDTSTLEAFAFQPSSNAVMVLRCNASLCLTLDLEQREWAVLDIEGYPVVAAFPSDMVVDPYRAG